MVKKLINGIIAVGLIFVVSFFVYQSTNQATKNTLTVGMMEWPPLMTTNAQGEPEGFDVDVAQELAIRMNKKLVITNLGSLSALFIALEQGKIDIIFSGLDITEQRLQQVNMVYYTGGQITSFVLLFWKQLPTTITSIEDLQKNPGSVICTEPGSAQEKYLDQCPFITKKSLPSVIEMVLDIKFGKSLALLVEPRVARRLRQQIPELVPLDIRLPKDFQVYGEGLALKKNRLDLKNEVETIITAMNKEGIILTFEKRWNLTE